MIESPGLNACVHPVTNARDDAKLCPPLGRRAVGAGRDVIEDDINDMKEKSTRYSDVVYEWFALLDTLCVAGTKKTHTP